MVLLLMKFHVLLKSEKINWSPTEGEPGNVKLQVLDVVSIHIPWLAEAECVAPVTIVDCQSIAANPVAVPLLAKVTPEGIVTVSPEVPNVNVVPLCGST